MTTDIARLIGKLTTDIAKLQRAVSALRALGATDHAESLTTPKKRKRISAEGRARMSAAAKARFAAKRNATTMDVPVEVAH